MTPLELPAYLRRMGDKARVDAPVAAANAMAQTYQGGVVRSMKGYGDDPSPPGTPPARKSGTLARSVKPEPAVGSGDGRATSSVAPHTVYARIQQLGGTIHVKRAPYLVWHDKWGWHKAKSVKLPARPYMTMNDERRTQCHNAAVRAVRGVLYG